MFYLFDASKIAKTYGTVQNENRYAKYADINDESDQEHGYPHHAESRWFLRSVQENEQLLNIDEALQRLGMGKFQYKIMLATGLFLAADSCEVVILSFLSHVAQSHNWNEGIFSDNNGFSEGDAYDTDTTDGGDTLSTMVLPGALLGAVLWGVLGDMFGRRLVFLAIAVIVSVFGFATSFATTYQVLVFTRIMVSFGIGGLTVPFNACSELMPPSARGKQLVLLQVWWILGALAVHLALQQREQEQIADSKQFLWRLIAGICVIPSVLATILAWRYVPESPRWLLARGDHEIALAILRQAAEINGKDPYETFPMGVILYSHEPEEVTVSASQIFNLFSSGWMKITASLFATYFGKAFLDHGTVSMAVSVFSNDERQQDYQALFSASSEFMGLILVYFVIDRVGRAATQCFAYAFGGVICLALSLLADYDPSTNPNLLLMLAFMAHLFINSATTATWIATTEVLATAIRTTGHGTAHAIARIGGAFSTYVLARTYSIPTVGLILFVTSLWTASASSNLPETNVKEMGVVHYPTRRRGTSKAKQRPNHSSTPWQQDDTVI